MYEKGQRVEHYDASFERFGNPWRDAVITQGPRKYPSRSGGKRLGVSLSHLIDGKPGQSQHLVFLDEDGQSDVLRPVGSDNG